jgi:DNA-binding phage protein
VAIKCKKWDSAEHLKTNEDIARYWEACLEEGGDGPAFITAALNNIARARGMSELDVAGVDEAKAELQEVLSFLKDPTSYGRLGAPISRTSSIITTARPPTVLPPAAPIYQRSRNSSGLPCGNPRCGERRGSRPLAFTGERAQGGSAPLDGTGGLVSRHPLAGLVRHELMGARPREQSATSRRVS